MQSRIQFLVMGVSLSLLLVVVAGCNRGPKTIKVRGTVTINGEVPQEQVDVEFHPQPTGRYGIGFTDKNGYYKVQFTRSQKGALPGPNIVQLKAYRVRDNDQSQYLPAEYNSQAKDNPELNVVLSDDNYEFNFDIKMDPDELAKHRANSAKEAEAYEDSEQ